MKKRQKFLTKLTCEQDNHYIIYMRVVKIFTDLKDEGFAVRNI